MLSKQLPDLVGLTVRAGRLVHLFTDGSVLPVVAGADGPTAVVDIEREVNELRTRLRQVDAEQISERAKADQLVADIRSSGADLLAGDNFAKVDEAYKPADQLAAEAAEIRKRIERGLSIVAAERGEQRSGDQRRSGDPVGDPTDRRNPGEIFARHESIERLRGDAGIIEAGGAIGNTAPVEIMSRRATRGMLRQRTTLDISQGGALVPIDQQLSPENIPVRPNMVLDLITMQDTDSDQVNWVLQTLRTNNAAMTAFGTALAESAYQYTLQTATVKRAGHFVPITRDMLADAAQLEGEINGQLIEDTRLAVESQVVNGDATGQNFRGILNTAGIGAQARGTDTYLDAAHKAITQVRLGVFRDPNAILIHPTDFEKYALAKDANGNYLFKIGEPESIWGLTPVVSPVIAQGTALVGWFAKAWMWLRAGVAVSASDSHQDFFTKGMVAVKAELRAAFAVRQPKAFATVTGL